MSSVELPAACYLALGERGQHGGALFDSTRLSAAAWYPDGQHGGAVAGLIARVAERIPTLVPMAVARVTVELFRVVPVTTLELVAEVIREGKRIQTVQVQVFDGAVEMARGLVQRLRVADLERDFPGAALEVPPGEPRPFASVLPFPDDGQVSFGRDAVEVSEAKGSFSELGPAAVWFRITSPLVAGEEMTPTQRAVVSGDFSNGLTRLAEPTDVVFMNSDLTVRLARPPIGEWIALDGESLWDRSGRGVATARMYDVEGQIGVAGQTLFLDRSLPGGG